MAESPLGAILDKLLDFYGAPEPIPDLSPFEWILRENIAYLADDNRRDAAFRTLRYSVGSDPEQILTASHEDLVAVARAGILADRFAEKLRECAKIAIAEFDSDLGQILKSPFAQAKKALMRFPGIGGPAAEKILLFCRAHPVLALDSNALRVLVRLGYGDESKDYARTYRSAQSAAAPEVPGDYDALIPASQLLRRHGQVLCRRNGPRCGICPVAGQCAFAMAHGTGTEAGEAVDG